MVFPKGTPGDGSGQKLKMEKRVFVSGATGFIGSRLVEKLVESGFVVHALYRSEAKAAPPNPDASVGLPIRITE